MNHKTSAKACSKMESKWTTSNLGQKNSIMWMTLLIVWANWLHSMGKLTYFLTRISYLDGIFPKSHAWINRQVKNWKVSPTNAPAYPNSRPTEHSQERRRLESALGIHFIWSEITDTKLVSKEIFQTSFESTQVSQLNNCRGKRIPKANNMNWEEAVLTLKGMNVSKLDIMTPCTPNWSMVQQSCQVKGGQHHAWSSNTQPNQLSVTSHGQKKKRSSILSLHTTSPPGQ